MLFYLHVNYCYGFLMTGNNALIDRIGGFDLAWFAGLKYGLCHLDWQERVRRAGLGTRVRVPFGFSSQRTAHPEMQESCRARYGEFSGVISDPARGYIPGTILDV